MNRALMPIVALAVTLAACSPRTEEPIISGFFSASRLRDRTALQKLATTSFDPASQGIVTGFEITGVATSETGGRMTKQVSISAPVKLPSGQTLQKNLVVTLERDVSGSGSTPARWMVTAIRDSAGGPSPPPR